LYTGIAMTSHKFNEPKHVDEQAILVNEMQGECGSNRAGLGLKHER
jgi:hypothetical protein